MAKELTLSDRAQLDSVNEIKATGEFDVHFEQRPTTFPMSWFDPLSDRKAEWAGVILSQKLQECALTFTSFSCYWNSRDTELDLSGEFHLPHLFRSLMGNPPECNDLASERERKLLSQLRLIDAAPRRATGEATFIRIEAHKENLELWHQDRYLYDGGNNSQGFIKMELDLCGYLTMLRITKGTFGWQHLFADTLLRHEDFRHHVASIKNMLDVFPDTFPAYDYSDLRARLEARR
ncbi:hypothetical protein [Streptomyces aurantiacus]|uniref:hypothetical protein n=1 Tax=Streptomyces aurantiacus TaxID=47760 RepID=UPI000B06EC1E|nr:hypothetical protein [Streptomyces aurantiacus]